MGCLYRSVVPSVPSILPPRFTSQTHDLRFYHLILCYVCLGNVKRTKKIKKFRVWAMSNKVQEEETCWADLRKLILF